MSFIFGKTKTPAGSHKNYGKGPYPHKTSDHKILCPQSPSYKTLKSTQAMGEAMKGVTKAMGQMNKRMNLPALQKIMREFEMQNERMEIVGDTMNDAIDDALEGDEEEEETEQLVNQVLDEIGIDINSELVGAPSTAVAAPVGAGKVPAQAEAAGGVDGGIDDDLQARLDNLRKM